MPQQSDGESPAGPAAQSRSDKGGQSPIRPVGWMLLLMGLFAALVLAAVPVSLYFLAPKQIF